MKRQNQLYTQNYNTYKLLIYMKRNMKLWTSTFYFKSYSHTTDPHVQYFINIECAWNSTFGINALNYGAAWHHTYSPCLPRTNRNICEKHAILRIHFQLAGKPYLQVFQCICCMVYLPVHVPAHWHALLAGLMGSQDSSVRIVTRLWIGWYGVPILAGTRGFLFSITPTPALAHPSILSKGHWG
jgi:hypothetical protein